ncbi:MAG: hypothetical protein K8L99_08025, partial [Anaerolineae bacterium]|nr:hypothetical protein [Anaerolineae bacterium]
MITSAQNDRVKQVRLLQAQAKRRRKEGLIVLEGVRLVRDALAAGHQPAYVLHTPDQAQMLTDLGVEGDAVSEDIMRSISDTQQPQGIIGVFPLPHIE